VFERLLPVLPVSDLEAEVAFYRALGFTSQVTFTGFTALRHGNVLFGVQASAERLPPADLAWQIEVTDIRAAHDLAASRGLEISRAPSQHPVGFWTVQLRRRCDREPGKLDQSRKVGRERPAAGGLRPDDTDADGFGGIRPVSRDSASLQSASL
jgi:predicted enzyme related to lactoylglutathione lyase